MYNQIVIVKKFKNHLLTNNILQKKLNEYSHYYLNMIIFVTNIEIWH